jgi:hypothetical protein
VCLLRDRAPVLNLVSDGVFVTRRDGALKPSDCCRWLGDDTATLRFRVPGLLINIALFLEFK